MSGRLILTVDQAVQKAKKWFRKVMDPDACLDFCEVILKNGEYCVTLKTSSYMRTIHIDAGSGTVMEPENGYLVTRRY